MLVQLMLCFIFFQAYGMSALPLNLIKGTRNASYERLENTEDIEDVEQNIQRIKAKVCCYFETLTFRTLVPCFF